MLILTFTIILGVLFKYLGRSLKTPARYDHINESYFLFYSMRHKLLVLTIAILGPLIMFLMLDIFIEKYTIYSYLLLLALSGLWIYDAIVLYLKIRYQRIELSKEGIISTQVFCKPQIIPWKKVIRLSSQERYINIISVDGDKIKIPTMIEGIPTLFTKLKEEMLPLTSKRALHGFDKWILAP